MGGVEYLQYLRTLAKRVDSDWEGVRRDLETIRSVGLWRSCNDTGWPCPCKGLLNPAMLFACHQPWTCRLS